MTGRLIELASEQRSYLRQRLDPKPGDPLYLHLSDLRLALEGEATDSALAVLDYGADLSPYRSLFPNSDYRCADLGVDETLDYQIAADGTVPAPSSAFDLVISTQVAEHVGAPAIYFSECHRLLKPGGVLLLSTHGMFEDHQFPHDYQRWTAEGLVRDLAAEGFVEIAVRKMTTGPRALMFLEERCLDSTFLSRKTFAGFTLWVRRSLQRRLRWLNHRRADSYYAGYRIVSDREPGHAMYIGLIARAKRPAD